MSLEISVYERAEREVEKDSERKREKERNRERARGRERERRIVRRNTCSHAKSHSSSRASSYCTGRGKETTTRIERKGGEERELGKKGARDTMPAMLVDSRISAECYAWNFLSFRVHARYLNAHNFVPGINLWLQVRKHVRRRNGSCRSQREYVVAG